MSIKFSPPDISEEEIQAVTETLRSGWITTGPKTRELEDEVTSYTGAAETVCLSSATAGMEMVLRLLEVGPGDEVITTPYTYSATAAVILHTGATPVFADVKKGSFLIDPDEVRKKLTSKTKVIIPVDIAGVPADYRELFNIIEEMKFLFSATSPLQEKLGRVCILADAAHSLGARYRGCSIGSVADFTSFSFHAVKNVTTSEGGAVVISKIWGEEIAGIKKRLKVLSLHGQSKDALEKTYIGSWEYDIIEPAYKCNMTDMAAALGLVQLKRYRESLIDRRVTLFNLYNELLETDDRFIIPSGSDSCKTSSNHLYLLRVKNYTESGRNSLISLMGERGVPCNVHYKPLPMFTAYKNLGYRMEDYPHAYKQFQNEITLPLHTGLTDEDVMYISQMLMNN